MGRYCGAQRKMLLQRVFTQHAPSPLHVEPRLRHEVTHFFELPHAFEQQSAFALQLSSILALVQGGGGGGAVSAPESAGDVPESVVPPLDVVPDEPEDPEEPEVPDEPDDVPGAGVVCVPVPESAASLSSGSSSPAIEAHPTRSAAPIDIARASQPIVRHRSVPPRGRARANRADLG